MAISAISPQSFYGNDTEQLNARLDRIEKNSKVAKTAGIIAGTAGTAALIVSGVVAHRANGVLPKAKGIVNVVSDIKDKLHLDNLNSALKKVMDAVSDNAKLKEFIDEIAKKSEPVKNKITEVLAQLEEPLSRLQEKINDPKFIEQLEELIDKSIKNV